MTVALASLIIFVNTFVALLPQSVLAAQQTVDIAAVVPSLCGNGAIDPGETCDGINFAGQTCVDRGFYSGSLSCRVDCTINVTQCETAPVSTGRQGSSGGGGGGAGPPPAAETKVVVSGRAFPGQKVILLKDAQIAASVLADSEASFSISLSGLSVGSYNFGIYSEDKYGRRSSIVTYPASVTSGVTIQIGGIFIAPTIAVDKSQVKRGENIAIFGQSVPRADIVVAVNSNEEIFAKTLSDVNGAYLYNFDTSQLEEGQHSTKAKAALGGAISSFGQSANFAVGTKTVLIETPRCPSKADLNRDCRVNLVDFSIAAFWYKRHLSSDFILKETERLNGDGKVDIIDFSIMAYYWTG